MSETKKLDQPKRKNHELYEGSVIKAIIKIATPIVLFSLVLALYGIIDTLMSTNLVEWEGGYNPSNIIGIIAPLAGIFISFMTLFAVGQALIYTKSYAQSDYEGSNRALNQSFTASTMMGVINVVIAMLVAEPYIRSVLASGGHTLSEEAIKDSANYLVVIVIAMIPMINQQAILRALRVEGKGLAALIFPTISIGVNITLNYVFMGILQIGFVGAGLASLIAPTVSLVMMIIYAGFQRRANNISMEFKLSYFKPNMKLVGLMALFGFTSVIRRLAYAYGNVVFSVYVTAIGVAEWKTFLTVGLQVSGFLNFFALGMGQAVGLLVAYYWGSGNNQKLKETVLYGIMLTIVTQLIFGGFLMAISQQLFVWYNIPIEGMLTQFTIAFALLSTGMILNAPLILGPFIFASMKNIRKGVYYVLIILVVSTIIPSIIFFSIPNGALESSGVLIMAAHPITALTSVLLTSPILLTWYRKL